MSYENQLIKMSSDELLDKFQIFRDYPATKAELLHKLDNPTDYRNCENCKSRPDTCCENSESTLYDQFVDSSTLCKEHEFKPTDK